MFQSLLLFSITEAFFSASPGPAVVMVVSAAMVGGWRVIHAVIFGVLLGNLFYFVISCAMVMGATQYNEAFFFYIKIAGAAYLVYLLIGRYCFSSKSNPDDEQQMLEQKMQKNFFKSGLAMQLANPKTILFFSAFLPQFVDIRYNIPMQFSMMAMLSWTIEYTILITYATGARLLLSRFNINWGDKLEHFGNAAMVFAVGWSLFSIWFE